jgi:transcription initiation factor TFIIIB Brf1 subunit/transcription initiation factor TFIIB
MPYVTHCPECNSTNTVWLDSTRRRCGECNHVAPDREFVQEFVPAAQPAEQSSTQSSDVREGG